LLNYKKKKFKPKKNKQYPLFSHLEDLLADLESRDEASFDPQPSVTTETGHSRVGSQVFQPNQKKKHKRERHHFRRNLMVLQNSKQAFVFGYGTPKCQP